MSAKLNVKMIKYKGIDDTFIICLDFSFQEQWIILSS